MKITLIEVSHPADKDGKWNAGLFWVTKGKQKKECWSYTEAMRTAADWSTGKEIIADYVKPKDKRKWP